MNSKLPHLLARRRIRRAVGLGFGGLAAWISISNADAQYASAGTDPPRIDSGYGKTKETGLRLGHFRLHAAFNALGLYDNNALYSDIHPQDDFVYQFSPGGDLTYTAPKFNLGVGYRYLFRDNVGIDLQDDHEQHSMLFDARYRLSRRISLSASNTFEKTSDPADVEIPTRVGRWTDNASAQTTYQTPGQDFDLSLKYSYTYQKYDTALAALSFYNNKVSVTSRINVSSHFRFLPKSIASGSAEYGQTHFTDKPPAIVASNDSKGFAFNTGLNSQFTRKLNVGLTFGFAFITFDAGPNAKSVTGGANAKFVVNPKLSVGAGYERRVQLSTFTNYYTDHHFVLDGNWKFLRNFEAVGKSGFDFLYFSGPSAVTAGSTRNDFVIQSTLGVNYQFIEWGKVKLEYRYDYRDSNAIDPIFGTSSSDFSKHQVGLGLELYY